MTMHRFNSFIFILLLLTFTMSASCVSDEEDNIIKLALSTRSQSVFNDDYRPAPNDTTSNCLDWSHPALDVLRKRADYIGNIKWMPLCDVPQRDGSFRQGIEVKGIPYSSVKELDKFVGQEVSFYTFLSAVKNPRSVLYTENVGQPPYKGNNCAAYYGTVCSMTINYALGLERPYETKMYGSLPFMKRVVHQDLEHAAPGDIIHFLYGHVILITNIIKGDDDKIKYVDVLEAVGSKASNKRYSRNKIEERLKKYEFVLYRYTDLYKLSVIESANSPIDSLHDFALSLNRGDKVTYSEDEGLVVVNVLKEGHEKLELIKFENGLETKVEEFSFSGTPDIELNGLTPGHYNVALIRTDGVRTDTVSFEILQTNVFFSYLTDNCIDIHFSSMNAVPEYLVFCREDGSRCFIDDISEEERRSCHKQIKCEASLDSLYLKVFFKGKYGRASNQMVPLKIDFAYTR